ncbi:MAG: cupin domain-containing protein [Candidatus Omnitrophota bacterium]
MADVKVQKLTKEELGKGDFVTFPEGLACTWDIKIPVKKHYNFK